MTLQLLELAGLPGGLVLVADFIRVEHVVEEQKLAGIDVRQNEFNDWRMLVRHPSTESPRA